ncbi:MAG: 16S rRNA (cytosine(967)-C(5))-methyltransferase RsmB [Clostridia bacterium]|nr:16S rRNA (cytosine(967)-C(5))-methyltransferase RsmB [Clostridia bacterium]
MTARQLALKVLYEVEKNGAYPGIELKRQLSAYDLSAVDKGFATELVYGVLKNRTRLDFIISKYSKQKLKKISNWIINILRMGVYQIIFLDKIPLSAAVNESVKLAKRYGHQASSGFVNGVLRNVGRNGDVEYPKGRDYYEIFYSHPKWLVDMLFDQYSDGAKTIIENNNKVPSTTVRVNILKTTTDDVVKSLTEKGITAVKTKCENVVKITGFGDISKLPEYTGGLITPQGLSSYMAADAVKPKKDEVIMDLCSAPGGKTTAMAEMCGDGAKIYAFDLFEHKIELINNNCKRLGIKNVTAKAHDGTVLMDEYVGKADKILADVPCSGLGIIRKKPDIKWNKETTDFEAIISIQKKILKNAGKYLKSGGILVYSTCTVNKNENDNIISEFAEKYNFKIDAMHTVLPDEEHDGFFICKMIKE